MKKVSALFDLDQFEYYVNSIITETLKQFVSYIKLMMLNMKLSYTDSKPLSRKNNNTGMQEAWMNKQIKYENTLSSVCNGIYESRKP